MANKTNLIILFLFTLFISAAATAKPASPAAVCASTLYPRLCRSFFASVESPALAPYSHERQFLIERALRISFVVHRRLGNTTHSDSLAVEDCRELFQANAELINSVANDLKSLELEYSHDTVHRVRTRLSTVVANGRTCREGLPESHDSVVITALSQSQRVYSVALGLVSQALSQRSPSHRRSSHHHHHHHHHSPHREVQSPPAPIRMAQSSTPPPAKVSGDRIRSDSPAPAAVPVPRMPEGMQSLTDLIKSLKKPSNGRLYLQGLRGNGIRVGDAVIVSKDSTGDFSSIVDAINSAPEKLKPEDGYFVIYVKKGEYKEYISISRHKTNILLLGDGINNTIITGNRSNATGWGTSNSATFGVHGDRFIAIDVTFKNTYGRGSMAVAVRNQADQSAFFRCSFEGYQDTLLTSSGNQFYRECDVYGTIDFIFGDAAAVFQKCHIIGRRPARGETVVVSAQSRVQIDESTAISFHNCTVDSAEPGSGSMFLGRPWRPYSRVVFMQSYLGEAVDPRGWMEWDANQTEHNTVYYGEYQNYGPGAGIEGRVDWPGVTRNLTDSAAESFTVRSLTNGGSWLPDMDIPFDIGMI